MGRYPRCRAGVNLLSEQMSYYTDGCIESATAMRLRTPDTAIGGLFMVGAVMGAFLFYNYGPSGSTFASSAGIVFWFLIGVIIVILQPYSRR